MNKIRNIVLLTLVACTSLLLADKSAQDPNGGIRYVDMSICFESYDQAKSNIASMRDEFNAKAEALKVREASLNSAQGELAIMDPSSAIFMEKRFQLESDSLTLDRDRKFLTELLKRRQMELMYSTYRDVKSAAAELASRDGYGAIVVIPEEFPPQPEDLAGALDLIQTSSVLWTNPNYDVTAQVLELLNN